MNLLQSLLKTYDVAADMGLVDINAVEPNKVILPIYHQSLRSTGKNIFQIIIDLEGRFIDGALLPEGAFIIYPITEESSAKSGTAAKPRIITEILDYIYKHIDKEDSNKKSISFMT